MIDENGKKPGDPQKLIHKFVRGNAYIRDLSTGPVLIGCPPESIKDVLDLGEAGKSVPAIVVLRDSLFDSVNKCISEELEQFIFYNYWNLGRKTSIVCSEEQKERITRIITISTYGRELIREETAKYYPRDYDINDIPDLTAEFKIFAGDITLDDLMQFHVFDPVSLSSEVQLAHPETGNPGKIIITKTGTNQFNIRDAVKKVTYKNITTSIKAPRVPFASIPHPSYYQLRNSISFVSTSSGFNPLKEDDSLRHAYGTTVSFVIWDDLGTGTVVDPPMGFPNWMRMMGLEFYKIQDLILTHTHFDHDVGTIERVLEDPVNIHTTETIMQSFLEKSSALTGISEQQIMNSIRFFPIRLHEPVKIGGFTYYFSHCIHPIETIRFTFEDHEGNQYYYSSDILYSRKHLQQWVDEGKISKERMEEIMTIPPRANVYIHEQGGPIIHTPEEEIAEMPEHIRNNMWIVHTDTVPQQKDGTPVPGVRLAKAGTIIPLQTPQEPQLDEFASTYHMLSKLDRIPLFHNLPMTSIMDLRKIMRLIKPKRYEPGSQLIRLGERPDKLYILVDGSVDILLPTDRDGDYPGEQHRMLHRNDFGFLIGDAIASQTEDTRDADVYAGLNGLTVLEIDEASIKELEESDIVLGDMIRKNREMRKHGVYLALEKIPVVKDLPYSQKQEFALLCTEHPLKSEDDRWLIKQGQWNEFVYILAEGQAEVFVQESDGKKAARKRVATSESNIFGEISILTESKTIASVHISSDLDKTRVYKMHKTDFSNFLRNNPNFNLNFRKNMEARIAETSQVRTNLMEALQALSEEYLKKGE